MVLSYANGTTTTDGSEQTLFDITSDAHFATWIFAHNMQAGDSIVIKVYVYDDNAATYRVYETQTLSGVQSLGTATFSPFVPTRRYKVSIQRIAGTDRAYTWMRIQG
jgi:hypothetical protein